MKKFLWTGSVALLGLVAWAGTGRAQTYDYLNSVAQRFSVFGNAGFNAFTMEDENQSLEDFNRVFGTRIDTIHNGLGLDFGFQYGASDFFLVGAEYGVLYAHSKSDLGFGATYEINLPVQEWGGFVKFALPVEDAVLLTLGVGLYSLWISHGRETLSEENFESVTSEFRGTALACKLFGGAEVFLGPHFALGADLGYRIAKIREVEDETGIRWINPDGTNFTLDYSGFFARGGLKYYF